MNKASNLLLFIFTCLTFTSCLTIEESYKFNKNGSGWMQYKIETADLAEMMKKFDSDDKADGFDAEKLSMRNLISGLEKIEGVSAINSIDDPQNNQYGLNFKFKNLDVLNQALNHIMMDEGSPSFTYFKMEDNVVYRSHKMSKKHVGGEFLENANSSDAASTFLNKMDYKIKYNFKQAIRVVYSEAETSIIGKKGKDLEVETTLQNFLNDSDALNTSIVLK